MSSKCASAWLTGAFSSVPVFELSTITAMSALSYNFAIVHAIVLAYKVSGW